MADKNAVENVKEDVQRLSIRGAALSIQKTGFFSFLNKQQTEYWPIATICRKGAQFRTADPPGLGDKVNISLKVAGLKGVVQLKGVIANVREQTRIGRTEYTHLVDVDFTEFSQEGWRVLRDIEEGKVGDVIR